MSNLNINFFPEFHRIQINHLSEIMDIVKTFPSYSDFGLTSMLVWGHHTEFLICTLNGNLIVKFKDYTDDRPFLSMIGSNDVDQTLLTIINYSKAQGWGDTLHLVPNSVVTKISNPEMFSIKEDVDNFDYILSVIYHAELKGGKNEDRRYRISKFLKLYGDKISIEELDIKDKATHSKVSDCFDNWVKNRGQEDSSDFSEKKAIGALLQFSNQLDLECLGVTYGDEMIGFSIFEILDDKNAVVHFEKGDLTYKGISNLLRHEVAKILHAKKIKFINYEQDLGVEGLRKTKQSLHPIHYLKKYKIKQVSK